MFEREKREWIQWWRELGLARKLLPAGLLLAYWLGFALVGGFKKDVLVSLLPVLLYYAGPRVRPLFQFVLPLILTGIVYDSQRYYADFIRGPIHVREPYEFDKHFFGISTPQGILTPNEWFQLHTHPLLDFVTGLAYLIFIPIFVATAAYFRFWVSRKGTQKISAVMLRLNAPQVMWSFFWVNLIGYSTYYWYAASPPWYVALYGFGPARLDVPANLAGCIRFDQLLGTHFFTEWYGRSADVHGAIPSLHIAYPLLAVLYAFKFGTARVFSIVFYFVMCFSAVYLNHHYVVDILWGSLYAIGTAWMTDIIWNWRLRRTSATTCDALVTEKVPIQV